MIFEFDRFVDDRPYPNLARHHAVPFTDEWRQFSRRWPYSEPPHLIEYFQQESVILPDTDIKIYLVSISHFDFMINWPELMPAHRLQQLRDSKLYLAFFYSEGDHPGCIRSHLETQFLVHGVRSDRLLLISANSSADDLAGSFWFADDELLFRRRNRRIAACVYSEHARPRYFTALVRTHKWWRATVMADFWRRGWHKLGYFSYNPDISVGEDEQDNCIRIDDFEGLRASNYDFLQHRFRADELDADQHNDHHTCVVEHYSQSYLHVVLETHMDANQSGGVFLTEKTFKPIKHAQPFVIFGAQHSLARLRDLGYLTFDDQIDTSYDSIVDTTDRFHRLMQILADMFDQGLGHMHGLYCRSRRDLEHNQQHFLSSKQHRLNTLLEKLSCACNHIPVGSHSKK